MISFVKKFSGISVSEIWFADKATFSDSFRLVVYMHAKKSVGKLIGIRQVSYTIENDLKKTTVEIFNNFSKTVQVEVKQAEKYGVECTFTDDIKMFENFYNEFASSRSIDVTSERRLLEMQPFLKITVAKFNGVILAAHSYLVDDSSGTVRLIHAASQRLSQGIDKQLSGRANKMLHYYDMLQFKKQGFEMYDFGGYAMNTTDKGLQGINKFKLSFGGVVVECKNYSSYLYYLLKKIAALTGRLGRA